MSDWLDDGVRAWANRVAEHMRQHGPHAAMRINSDEWAELIALDAEHARRMPRDPVPAPRPGEPVTQYAAVFGQRIEVV